MSSDSARSGTCNPRHIAAPRPSSRALPLQKFMGLHYLLNLAMLETCSTFREFSKRRNSPGNSPTVARAGSLLSPCLFKGDFLQQFMPSLQRSLILRERSLFFRIPALEAIVLSGAAEIQVFEQFLPFRTQEKIRKKERRMRPLSIGVYGRSPCTNDINIHGHPRDRGALLRSHVGRAVKLAG